MDSNLPPEISKRATSLQARIESGLRTGSFSIGGGIVSIELVMPGLRNLIRILGSRHGFDLCQWLLNVSGIEVPEEEAPLFPFNRIESLSVKGRVVVLGLVDWMLEDWPSRFLEGVYFARLDGSFLLEDHLRELPFWYAKSVVEPLLFQQSRWNWSPPRRRLPRARLSQGFHASRPNERERFQFLMEHTEVWDDLDTLARRLIGARLFIEDRPVELVRDQCRKMISIIRKFPEEPSRVKEGVGLSGFLQRQALRRRFKDALEASLMARAQRG